MKYKCTYLQECDYKKAVKKEKRKKDVTAHFRFGSKKERNRFKRNLKKSGLSGQSWFDNAVEQFNSSVERVVKNG